LGGKYHADAVNKSYTNQNDIFSTCALLPLLKLKVILYWIPDPNNYCAIQFKNANYEMRKKVLLCHSKSLPPPPAYYPMTK